MQYNVNINGIDIHIQNDTADGDFQLMHFCGMHFCDNAFYIENIEKEMKYVTFRQKHPNNAVMFYWSSIQQGQKYLTHLWRVSIGSVVFPEIKLLNGCRYALQRVQF